MKPNKLSQCSITKLVESLNLKAQEFCHCSRSGCHCLWEKCLTCRCCYYSLLAKWLGCAEWCCAARSKRTGLRTASPGHVELRIDNKAPRHTGSEADSKKPSRPAPSTDGGLLGRAGACGDSGDPRASTSGLHSPQHLSEKASGIMLLALHGTYHESFHKLGAGRKRW